MGWIIIAVIGGIVLLASDPAFADGNTDSDIVARIVGKFQSQAASFASVAKKYALQLFGYCATLEVAYLGIKAALGRADIGETLKNFCISLLACGFFLAVINHYEAWSASLINGLRDIAGEMGNTSSSSDTAFKEAIELVSQIWKVIQDMSVWNDFGLILGMTLALFIVIVCFCMITAQIVLIKCEAYVAMAAACILVGLGGTSFLRDYAVNVCKYIVSVAFKLFVMQLVIGIGYDFMREAITPTADFPTILVIIGVAIVLLGLVKKLPETVAGIIQGSHIGAAPGGLMHGMQTTGALALAAGAGAYAGGVNSYLAYKAAKAGGASGVGETIKGTAGELWGGIRQAHANREESRNTVESAIRTNIGEHIARNLVKR